MTVGPKLRVTVVVDTAVYGGAEAYVATLLRLLADRVDFTLVATDSVPPRLVDVLPPAVPIVAVRSVGDKGQLFRVVRLTQAIRRSAPDVVHVNANGPTNNRWALGAALLLGVPVVVTMHLGAALDASVQRKVLRAAYRRVAAGIAVSRQVSDQLVDDLHMPRSRVTVVPNGVATPERPPPHRPTGDRPPVVGTLGRLVEQKGLDVLLEAVRLLHTEGVGLRVRIAGSGPEGDRLREAGSDLPIEFLGDLAEPASYLQELDVFCNPARDEGLPFAVLEAMAAGLPCVVTDVGDVRHAVADAGVVVPPADASALATGLRSVLEDPSRRRDLGFAAHDRVRRLFSADAMAAAVLDCYVSTARQRD